MILTVRKIKKDNVWRDCVNIAEPYRQDSKGQRIKEGTICKLSADGRTTYIYVKGIIGETVPIIKMDEKTRNDLGVVDGKDYDFELKESGWLGQFYWAWNATDPSPRIAARSGLMLGGLSVALTILGLVLSLLSDCRAALPK